MLMTEIAAKKRLQRKYSQKSLQIKKASVRNLKFNLAQ